MADNILISTKFQKIQSQSRGEKYVWKSFKPSFHTYRTAGLFYDVAFHDFAHLMIGEKQMYRNKYLQGLISKIFTKSKRNWNTKCFHVWIWQWHVRIPVRKKRCVSLQIRSVRPRVFEWLIV